MRILVLILSLVLAAGAVADDEKKHKPHSVAKELDKSSPLLAPGGSGTAGGPTEAADAKERHNRSKGRSSERNKGQQGDLASGGKRRGGLGNENRCSMGRLDADCDNDSVPVRETCGNGVDNDCDGADTKAAPANQNVTRSNRTATAADTDYNSSRSNQGSSRSSPDQSDTTENKYNSSRSNKTKNN